MHIYSYKYVSSHYITLQQHVSVTSVTNIRVSYNKNTVNIQIILRKCTVTAYRINID